MSGPIQSPMPLAADTPSAAQIAAANRSAGPLRENQVTRLVDAVVARLREALPGPVHVEEYPDVPARYDLGGRRAAALVHYRGSKYRPPAGNGAAVQPRAMQVDVHLVTRGLGGTRLADEALTLGAYDLIEAVRLALQGRTLEGVGPVIVTDDGAQGERDGTWTYVVQLSAATRAVATAPYSRPDVAGYPERDP